MALGKIQSQIVTQLATSKRLTPEQRDTIANLPGEPTGEALDKLLQEDYRITPFQMLVAKGRALGLAAFNVARVRVTTTTFQRIPKDFCQESLVFPVGEVGDFLLVAFANPFEVTAPVKIQEMTGKKVIRLLAREKDIREKFSKGAEQQVTDFDDVVKMIGDEFGPVVEVDKDDVSEESGPIIQLSTRIIEDAYFLGASDIHVEPQ
jgi:type IV pilus assembly protein PilB